MSTVTLQLKGVVHTFKQGRSKLEVLKGANLEVHAGEIVALVGPSGAGKSTLLHIAGLLDKPNDGSIEICGKFCGDLSDDERTNMRRHNIGFVYQYHHLLPEFSAEENIAMPQIIAGRSKNESKSRAREMLEWMGLAERAKHRPGQLSGGEQQRVAIGRALANVPKLLLADEPTGNLDPDTADEVFAILMKLVRGAGLAALIATHNPTLAGKMDRTVRLENGQ
ncbi:MAG: ABC transporter ATP-binding protein [Rhodospirillales bacterium]